MRMQRIVWGFAALTTAAWIFGLWAEPPRHERPGHFA